MRINASESFSNSMATSTKTGGTATLEPSRSQSSLAATTTTTNTTDSTGAAMAMTAHLEYPNVKKETAEWSANDKEQLKPELFFSSPLVEELSLEQRESGAAKLSKENKIQEKSGDLVSANVTLPPTNVMHATKETTHGECISSSNAPVNFSTSVINATPSPQPPPLLNTNAYTAAALHGKRLPPSRQRSSYSVNAINAINKSNNNNKVPSNFYGNVRKENICCSNTDNCKTAPSGFERANCEQFANCKDANNNTNCKNKCDNVKEETDTIKQFCASPQSDEEVYREVKSALLPSTNTYSDKNDDKDNNTNEVRQNVSLVKQTSTDAKTDKTNNATHCNVHLRHANLYINLPSSFVRSSQLCDSEVESVVTTTSSTSSSTTTSNVGYDNNYICSTSDSIVSISCSCNSSSNSSSVNSKSNNRKRQLSNSDEFCYHSHPLYAHHNNNFHNYRNHNSLEHWHLGKEKKKNNMSSGDIVHEHDCRVCNGDVNRSGKHNEAEKILEPEHVTTQCSDKSKCKTSYIPHKRHFPFYAHATHTQSNAEPFSHSCCHSHSAPTYYKRYNNSNNTSMQYCENSTIKNKYNNCTRIDEKGNNLFKKGNNYTKKLTEMNSKDDNISFTTIRTTFKKNRCTHSSSLTLFPSSLSLHHVSSNICKGKRSGNRTNNNKCTPLSSYSSPHHFHYHNHTDEQNSYTNNNKNNKNNWSKEKVEDNSMACKQQKEREEVERKESQLEERESTENNTNSIKKSCDDTNIVVHAHTFADKTHTRKIVNKHQFHIQVPTEPYCSPPSSSSSLLLLSNPIPASANLINTSANTSNITSNVLSSSSALSRSSARKTGMKCNPRAQYTNFMHSEFSAVEVLPGLYLGTRVDANDLQLLREHDISLVINVSEDCPVPPAESTNPLHIRVIQFALKDHSDEVIAPFFVPITDIIHQQLHRRQAYQQWMKKQANKSTTCVIDKNYINTTLSEKAEQTVKVTTSPIKLEEQQAETTSTKHAKNEESHHDYTTSFCSCKNINNIEENNKQNYCSIPDSVKPYSSSLHKAIKEHDTNKITTTSNNKLKSENNNVVQDKEQVSLNTDADSSSSNNNSNRKTNNRKNKPNSDKNKDDDDDKSDFIELLHRFLPSESMQALPCVPSHWPCVDARDCGGVLIHCRMGVSRSASFVLAYLILYGNTLAPLTDPSSLFTTLPFTEKQLAERVGGRVTWGAAFQSCVNEILRQNTKIQHNNTDDKTARSLSKELKIKETTLKNSNTPPPQHFYTLPTSSSSSSSSELSNEHKRENVQLNGNTSTSSSSTYSSLLSHKTSEVNNMDKHGSVNDISNLARESFCKMLEEFMQTDSFAQNSMELRCITPRARAAYNCIACWRLRQQRQRWALAKHVLMGHSHTLLSTNSSFTSVTSSTSQTEHEEEQEKLQCNFYDYGSPTQHASFALIATSPLSCGSHSHTCSRLLDVQDMHDTNNIRNNSNNNNKEKKTNNVDSIESSVNVCKKDNNTNGTSSCCEPNKVASVPQCLDEESLQSPTTLHIIPSRVDKEDDLCTCTSKSLNRSKSFNSNIDSTKETTLEGVNSHSVPVLRETSYSRRRKMKQASLVHRRESYYGHDTLGKHILQNYTPHKLCLHTSFATHSLTSFSPSSATPLSAWSATNEAFYNANTSAAMAATPSISSSSPLLSCMRSAQLTPFTRPLISSPVSSFASAPLTSPLTEQMKSTFEENIVRSSMRPPYLEIVTGMSYREAFEFLKSKKHDISPNIGFVLALRELAAGNDFSVSSSN